ncbi:unnamed protein product [Owenia fusiformis]|uniref:Uncharacterized protein n=1 Tax=Owenia fusiformis TaxID=6347 RepID=A0A8J1XXG1_OWEFU|nr:unnamed protein product [Owenia fusiformis]
MHESSDTQTGKNETEPEQITPQVAVHRISFRGLTGIIFSLLGVSLLIYAVGFLGTSWSVQGETHQGLWSTCQCRAPKQGPWLIGAQILTTLGLIGLVVCLAATVIYMTVHTINKNKSLRALISSCFITAILMVSGFITYGSHYPGLHWSFAFCTISMIITLGAGGLSIKQMLDSKAGTVA